MSSAEAPLPFKFIHPLPPASSYVQLLVSHRAHGDTSRLALAGKECALRGICGVWCSHHRQVNMLVKWTILSIVGHWQYSRRVTWTVGRYGRGAHFFCLVVHCHPAACHSKARRALPLPMPSLAAAPALVVLFVGFGGFAFECCVFCVPTNDAGALSSVCVRALMLMHVVPDKRAHLAFPSNCRGVSMLSIL